MKKLFDITDAILSSPYTNIFLSMVFLYTSVTAIIDDYASDIKGVGVNHGIALYGLVMFFKSALIALRSVSSIKHSRDQIKGKGEKG